LQYPLAALIFVTVPLIYCSVKTYTQKQRRQ